MLSVLRMLWDELKGKRPSLRYTTYTLENIAGMLFAVCSSDLQHNTEHKRCLTGYYRLKAIFLCGDTN